MKDITPFLLSLLSLPGLSGYEQPASDIIAETWRPLVDELTIGRLGSLHGLRKSRLNEKRPTLMIAAHMDAIGLMVKTVEHGFLTITTIGGIDPRVLPGQLMIVHGKKDLPGLVQLVPDRLVNNQTSSKAPEKKDLFVDTGLTEKELVDLVKPGDLISFAQPPFELTGGYIAGHSLDNRASVAALTICLEEIKNYNLDCNVVAAATVQEELHAIGAATSTFSVRPDLAFAVDVTFAKGPGSNDYRSFPLGEGPAIGLGANNHPALTQKMTSLAEELDIPYFIEAMPTSSGTDGMAMQITANGIPTQVLGMSLRYMHTSVEMTSLKDIARTGRLLARFITDLNPETFKSMFEEKVS
ncbi:MAG: aminopeptidase [Chloroflexi bacterium HGW-Chloroflexi-7]|nr:MAG: aminopeptidase [Chloroflexi bacterium HGW-Chloroflexi-7]